jgi:hypothetical protein
MIGVWAPAPNVPSVPYQRAAWRTARSVNPVCLLSESIWARARGYPVALTPPQLPAL